MIKYLNFNLELFLISITIFIYQNYFLLNSISYFLFQMNYLVKSQSQVKIPKKQGSLYTLNVAKNNGPFLPKDIMPNNPKSIGLLVGSQIIKSHLVMVRSLQDSENRVKKSEQSVRISLKTYQSNNLSCSQNLFDFSDYLETQLSHIKKNTQLLYLEQKKFKIELQELQYRINTKNAQNTSQISPLLKELYSKVKQRFNQQKNQAYKLTRQIQTINHDKASLIQQILLCQSKINRLQKIVGINHVEYDQIHSSDQQGVEQN